MKRIVRRAVLLVLVLAAFGCAKKIPEPVVPTEPAALLGELHKAEAELGEAVKAVTERLDSYWESGSYQSTEGRNIMFSMACQKARKALSRLKLLRQHAFAAGLIPQKEAAVTVADCSKCKEKEAEKEVAAWMEKAAKRGKAAWNALMGKAPETAPAEEKKTPATKEQVLAEAAKVAEAADEVSALEGEVARLKEAARRRGWRGIAESGKTIAIPGGTLTLWN